MVRKKRAGGKTVITIKPSYQCRAPHKPTRPHRDKTKYTRKGKQRGQRQTELQDEMSGT